MKKVVSLKTAKLLVEKGIVLKTKERCIKWSVEDVILGRKNKLNIPRPDIPELLAELSNENLSGFGESEMMDWDEHIDMIRNPDKLAQALIWVKERGAK